MQLEGLVELPAAVDRALAPEHARILAGASIGASLQAAGWEVSKTGHGYFQAAAPAPVAAGMAIAPGTALAAHAYRLQLARRGRQLEYALIIELHHPDYLGESELEKIYGEEAEAELQADTRRLLERGMERLGRFGLTLGE
jgi:hypothetical protein